MKVRLLVFVVLGILLPVVSRFGAAAAAADASEWECVTERLYAGLKTATLAGDGVKESTFARRTQGMLVDPTSGRIFLHVHKNGLYESGDRGATWSPAAASPIGGRGESGFTFNGAQPFAGRFAVITIDGRSGHTVDGGKNWTAWSLHRRGFDTADLDWSSPTPQTIFALNHEPYYRCLSTDGGKTWTDLETQDYPNQVGNKIRLGVFDAETLLVGSAVEAGLSASTDRGKSWRKVADFRPLGLSPVHYGKTVYWAAAEGVFCSTNGRDWSLVGTPLPNATWGPYFGRSEADMMVVTDTGFHITADAGRTWTKAASFYMVPDSMLGPKPSYSVVTTGRYYGWDHAGGYLYAGGMGGSVYRRAVGIGR